MNHFDIPVNYALSTVPQEVGTERRKKRVVSEQCCKTFTLSHIHAKTFAKRNASKCIAYLCFIDTKAIFHSSEPLPLTDSLAFFV